MNSYNLEINVDHTFFVRGIGGLDGIWVHNKDCWDVLPDNVQYYGKTTSDGRKLVSFKDETGKQVTAYQGEDGRWYNPNTYKPDDIKAPMSLSGNIKLILKEQFPNQQNNWRLK